MFIIHLAWFYQCHTTLMIVTHNELIQNKNKQTWSCLCLVVRFFHPLVRRPRRRRRLGGPRPWRALPWTGQITPGRGRHLPDLPLPGLPFREVMRIRRPFSSRRPVPRAPLLLLKVLRLPAVPTTRAILPLALVHGERVDVVHHASITVPALHTLLSQHSARAVRDASTTRQITID